MKYIIICLSALWLADLVTAASPAETIHRVSTGYAEETELHFGGYARGSAYLGTGDIDYPAVFAEFCARPKLSYQGAYLLADIRIRSGWFLDEEFTHLQVKEAYAGYSGEKLQLSMGNQIVNWGRTDGFNPTNNLNSSDYFFLTSDPDDQLLPSFMLRGKYLMLSGVDLELIAAPLYSPSVYRFDLFDMGDNVRFTDPVLPATSYENSSLAARLNFEFPGIGFSVSWFRGYDPFHAIDIDTVDWAQGAPEIVYTAKPYRKNTIGVDFVLAPGGWIFRGEAAYNLVEDYEINLHIPNPDLQYVLAVERSLAGFIFLGQYIGSYVSDYTSIDEPVMPQSADPFAQFAYANEMIYYESLIFNRKLFNQQDEFNHAVSASISKSFFYNILSLELSGYYNINTEEYFVRSKIDWNIADNLTATVGGSFMKGPEKTPFHYSSTVMNGVFLELKAGF